jgi:hypothetical protein
MSQRFARATGTISTIAAGVLLAALALSHFGSAASTIAFCALYVLGTAAHRTIFRRVR